jgi:transcriptional repressor NrdR
MRRWSHETRRGWIRSRRACDEVSVLRHLGDKVVDSRESKEGDVIRRRRQCLNCGKRFTSRERIEEIEYRVVKKDGNRETFQRQKLIAGLLTACEKRPVSVQQLERIADRIEAELQERPEREMSTKEIGARLMQELKKIDQVAYVRFASVYRQFRDVGQFAREVDELQKSRG